MGAYAQVSERLIERGYAAIPIVPGEKAPGFFRRGKPVHMRDWQAKFGNGKMPSSYLRQLWAAGDTGVGVVAGPPSGGMVSVDIDIDDTAIMTALLSVLPAAQVRKNEALKAKRCSSMGPRSRSHDPGRSTASAWWI
jgi:hypothetical protein